MEPGCVSLKTEAVTVRPDGDLDVDQKTGPALVTSLAPGWGSGVGCAITHRSLS